LYANFWANNNNNDDGDDDDDDEGECESESYKGAAAESMQQIAKCGKRKVASGKWQVASDWACEKGMRHKEEQKQSAK